MAENRVSAVITDQDMTDIDSLVNLIAGKLSFTIAMDNASRRRLRKMGGKRVGYVKEVLIGINNHSSEIPSSFSIDEFEKDLELLKKISAIRTKIIAEVLENLEDTELQLRHELIMQADQGYAYLKIAGKKGNASVKDSLKNIAKNTAKKNKLIPGKEIDVPAGGKTIVSRIIPESKFVNSGNTILEISEALELPDNLKVEPFRVLPGNSVKLPKGFTSIIVKNLSDDQSGKFIVKIKLKK